MNLILDAEERSFDLELHDHFNEQAVCVRSLLQEKNEKRMVTDLQLTLLQLFQQVSDNPDNIPDVPVDGWQQGSLEEKLLTSFRILVERLHQNKQVIQKSAPRFSLAVQGANDGLWDWDLQTDNVYFSPRWKSMLGYEDDEIAHHFDEWLNRVHPDDLARAQATIQDYLDGHTTTYSLEHRLQHRDGSYRWILARGAAMRNKDGKPSRMAGSHTDITERKQAQEQLHEKEAQYRSIFEATTDALFIVDLEDGHVVEANPAACNIYGYSYEEFIGLPPNNIIHPDKLPNFMEKALPSVRADGERQVRGTNLHKDGTAFPIDLHMTSFKYQGKLHMLVVGRDITEQMRAEDQLREKEVQYRSIFEASTDGLVINDLENGHFVEVNPAMYRMHGYTYEEFIALHPKTFIHPDSHPLFVKYIDTVKEGKKFQSRAIDIHKDGTSFPVEVHGTTFDYKGKPHALAVVRDVTEQVRAEEQLLEKEEQYRSIFEATTDAMLIIDLEESRVVEINPAACRVYGYTYEEFIGLSPTTFMYPDSRPFFPEFIDTIKAGQIVHLRDKNIRKDGSIYHIELYGIPFIYKGKLHGMAVVRDITEQVQAYQLLEQRVEERTRELSTLLDISHDITSIIELKPLLALVLDQLKIVVDYTGSSFSILEEEDLVLFENRGPAPLDEVLQLHFPIKTMGSIWEKLNRREPVIVPDVLDDSLLAQTFRTWMGKHLKTPFSYIRAWMAIPLSHKEQIIGMLTLSSREPNYYTPRHASLALAIANQAAVALANARLYEQAQELAALEERQRLARELHDSVSQALYGITLGTHTARTLLERDPGKVAEPLDYVLTQAEAALTEMRALIFELRPESLETEGLVAALSRQGAALHVRYEIEVLTELCDEPDLPLKVKQQLYRIVQEALHNTAKHARAKKVNLCMRHATEELLLEVCDDGIGFDATNSFPGHLGLHSMRERIAHLGGSLQIESTPQQGTCIRAHLPTSPSR